MERRVMLTGNMMAGAKGTTVMAEVRGPVLPGDGLFPDEEGWLRKARKHETPLAIAMETEVPEGCLAVREERKARR